MKLGATFPTTEIGNDPAVIRDWVQTAEGLGYDYVVTYDHVLGAVHEDRAPALTGPYTEQDPFHEPFPLFGFMAAVTERIHFATGIVILPQRQTALVAKQAAELAVLSGNRFRLGIGTGWNHVEYESLGVPFEGRGKRFDEQVEVLRRLWGEDVVDFTGTYHRIDRAGLLPRPSAPIPLWFAAMAPIALKRAARVGDGIALPGSPRRVRKLAAQARALLAEEGRPAEGFGFEAATDFAAGPEAWQQDLSQWKEAQGTHLLMRAMDTGSEQMGMPRVGYDGPKAYLDALETFIKAVR